MTVVSTAVVMMMMLCVARTANVAITPSTSNWKAAITNLQPGDVATFSAGTYDVAGYYEFNFVGTAAAPVTIQTAPGAKVIITQSAQQNTMNIKGSYFVIKGLEITGTSRGVRLFNNAHHLELNGLIIHDVGDTALSANDGNNEYYNISVRNCEIYNTGSDTGECLYFGCVSDGCRVHDVVIENNICHDTQYANGGSIGSAFQVKPGSYNVIARNNVCYNVLSVCILFYDDYDRGVNIIEGNIILNTIQDAGIQATAGAIIRNNIVLNAGNDGISIIPNSVKPNSNVRNIKILHNTVIGAQGFPLRLNSIVSSPNIVIANNVFDSDGSAIKSASDLSGIIFSNNAIRGEIDANGVPASTYFSQNGPDSELQGYSNDNVYPTTSSSLISKGSSQYSSSYDFNGKPRSKTTPTVGAYEYSTPTNPGWLPTKSIKPAFSTPASPTSAPATPEPTLAPTPEPTPEPTTAPECMCPCECTTENGGDNSKTDTLARSKATGRAESSLLWVATSVLVGMVLGSMIF